MKELEGIQAKQAKMLDLTEGQQERMYKIESELEELKDTLENQEDNVRNMICNGCEEDNYDEIKKQRTFFKEWEEQDYNDEFYDRSKANKFNKAQNKPKVTKADIKENDTYDSVKGRLNNKMKEKDALMLKLIEINHESKQKKNTEDYDELEAFMEQNNKELKKDEKEYISQRLKDANEEIEKLNSMLTFLMPSSFSTAQKLETKPNLPDNESPSHKSDNNSKKHDQKQGGGLSEVFQKLSSMSKIKEQELKKQKVVQEQPEGSIYETPRFYQSESNDPVTVTDVDPALADDQMGEEVQEQNESHNYFKEII